MNGGALTIGCPAGLGEIEMVLHIGAIGATVADGATGALSEEG